MFKKILSISALSLSALLLILSVIDVFVDATLFEWIPLKIAVVLMLTLSLTVTIVACIIGAWRRPLLLLACLLQTPVAGAMAVVWVYGLCFPDVMPLQALFPFLVIFTSLASVIQATVVVVGEGMYEPLHERKTVNDIDFASFDFDDDQVLLDEEAEEVIEEASDDEEFDDDEDFEDEDDDIKIAPVKKPAPKAAPKAAPKVAPKAMPREEEESVGDEDELSPDYEEAPKQTVKASSNQTKKVTDPFSILQVQSDFDQWKKSVNGFFDEKDEKDGE